jgi:hypothetical protein
MRGEGTATIMRRGSGARIRGGSVTDEVRFANGPDTFASRPAAPPMSGRTVRDMRALTLVLLPAVLAGRLLLDRSRSKPVWPPFWQNASFSWERLGQHFDPRTGDWIIVDDRDGEILARGPYHGAAFLRAADNLQRRDRGLRLRSLTPHAEPGGPPDPDGGAGPGAPRRPNARRP